MSLGAQDEAIQALKNALQREREFPHVKTQAWSRYALLVAERRLDHLYDDALQILTENPLKSYSFAVDVFRWNAACALIASAKGLRKDASECATNALKVAELTVSGLRYHPRVGLVGSQYEDLRSELHRIAGS